MTENQWIIRSENLGSAEHRRLAFYSATGLLIAYLIILIDPIQAPDLIDAFLKEDGVYESLTALFFAVASVLFGLAWWRKRHFFLLLFAVVFFVGAGEEISWAQRIFDYNTPDAILEHNTQQEFNLHNLELLSKSGDSDTWIPTVGQLFNLFWLCYCVLIPIAAYASTRINSLTANFRLPIVNPWIAVFFPINYLVAKLIQFSLPIERLSAVENYTEVAEFVFSLLFALVALDLLLRSTHLSRNTQDSLPDD